MLSLESFLAVDSMELGSLIIVRQKPKTCFLGKKNNCIGTKTTFNKLSRKSEKGVDNNNSKSGVLAKA